MSEKIVKESKNTPKSILKKLHSTYLLYLVPLPFLIAVIISNTGSRISLLPHSNDFSLSAQQDMSTVYDTTIVEYDSLSETDTTLFLYSDTTITECRTEVNHFDLGNDYAEVTFTLGEKNLYPYAGVLINTYTDTTDTAMLDLSNMDILEMDLKIEGGKGDVNVYFSEFIEGYTSLDKNMSWKTYEFQVPADEKMSHYKINLNEFNTDSWWYEQQAVPQKDIPNSDLSNIINLVIENGNYEEKGIPLTIRISNVYFTKNMKPTNIGFIIGTLLYYLAYFLIMKFGLSRVMGPVVIPYKQLEVTSYLDDETQKIEEYVAHNYHNPELTVKVLCADTGITHTKVQTILKKQFQLTFRQYLNKIKVHEAKRLLLETDRQVTDIAYRVGYKNVTHFNRIFKEMIGLSPNQFRKANK